MEALAVRVLVVDDYEPFRRFLCSTLGSRADLQIVGEASDGVEAVQKAAALRPDLILLDIGLPILNGVDAARQILKIAPESKILFISQESSVDVVQKALSFGVLGYVFKAQTGSELLVAVDAVRQGSKFISSGLPGKSFRDARNSERRPISQVGFRGARTEKGEIAYNHEVQFYSDDACFVVNLTCFVEAELEVGNVVIAVMTESHGKSLHQRLQANGVDVAMATTQKRYIPLEVGETLVTFMESAGPNRERFMSIFGQLIRDAETVAAARNKRIVVFGEMVSVLCSEGRVQAAIQLEQLGNELAQTHSLYLRCAYRMSKELKGEPYAMICAEHSAVLPAA